MGYIFGFLCVLCVLNVVVEGDLEGRNKGRGKGSMWWGIAKAGEPNNLSPLSPGVAFMDPTVHGTLRRKQRRLARENPGVLVAVAKGANQAIHECNHQFRNRRWNCSTRNFLRGKNLFGKIVDRGCRETAFIYAITSAAVTHAIARACSEGTIETCNCDYSHKGRQSTSSATAATNNMGVAISGNNNNGLTGASGVSVGGGGSGGGSGVKDWEWGGCSDNIAFGMRFSREFVDTGERGRTLREKMNLHNNEAGRIHVQSLMRHECKCHGMSGSCTVKTCWMRLPPFRVIGDQLKDRFDGATRVQVNNGGGGGGGGGGAGNGNTARNSAVQSNKHHHKQNNAIATNSIHSKRDNRGSTGGGGGGGPNNRHPHKYNYQLRSYNPDHKPPGPKDLVYWETSPGFCERNVRLGIQGTYGRQCNDTSMGVDGCDLMCCGRSHQPSEVVVVERCNCTFHWCCEVKCDICRTKKTIYTCL